jgi:hypothetical protein
MDTTIGEENFQNVHPLPVREGYGINPASQRASFPGFPPKTGTTEVETGSITQDSYFEVIIKIAPLHGNTRYLSKSLTRGGFLPLPSSKE